MSLLRWPAPAPRAVDRCGPVQVTLGNAGNWQGSLVYFQDTLPREQWPGFCANPRTRKFPWFQPQACWPAWANSTNYCITSQPEWSAYRDPSFGHGMLEILNATHASYAWNRNQDGHAVVVDQVMLIRGQGGCRNGR